MKNGVSKGCEGYVYVLTNSYVPNVVKIGHTTRSPQVRAMEISQGTGVVGTWQVEYYWTVDDSYASEQMVFRELSEHRLPRSEMFQISAERAKMVMDAMLQVNSPEGLFNRQQYEAEKHAQIERKREEAELEKKCRKLNSEILLTVNQLVKNEIRALEEEKTIVALVLYSPPFILALYWFYDSESAFTIFFSLIQSVLVGGFMLMFYSLVMNGFLDDFYFKSVNKKIEEKSNEVREQYAACSGKGGSLKTLELKLSIVKAALERRSN